MHILVSYIIICNIKFIDPSLQSHACDPIDYNGQHMCSTVTSIPYQKPWCLFPKNDFDPAFKPIWCIFLVTRMQVPVLCGFHSLMKHYKCIVHEVPYSKHKEYAVDHPLLVAITKGSTLLFTLREILRIHSHLP